MNPIIKQRWIEALRSGDYAQGRQLLRDNVEGVDRYCCLGVLCDLAAQDGRGTWTGTGIFVDDLGNAAVSMPTGQITEWAGVDGNAHQLANMNDEGGSFEKIANWIEMYL